jgi:hypothetical protein
MKLKLFFSTIIITLFLTGCSGSDDSSGGGAYSLKINVDGQTSTYSNFIGDQGLANSGGSQVFTMAIGSEGAASLGITNYDYVWEVGDYSSASGDDITIVVTKGQTMYISNSDVSYNITNLTDTVIEGTFEGTFEVGIGSGVYEDVSGSFKAKVFNLGN